MAHDKHDYNDYKYSCLCTFLFNYSEHKLGMKTVELVLLDVALCIIVNGGLQVEYADTAIIWLKLLI